MIKYYILNIYGINNNILLSTSGVSSNLSGYCNLAYVKIEEINGLCFVVLSGFFKYKSKGVTETQI